MKMNRHESGTAMVGVSWHVAEVHLATKSYPEWADVLVDGVTGVRINPELLDNDQVASIMLFARVHEKRILRLPWGETVATALGGKVCLLFNANGTVLMIDTEDRVRQWEEIEDAVRLKAKTRRHRGK
jgi:hypothetical protein